MDWISGIQKAVDYMEAHITEELKFDEIAKQAYSSSFHFQRVFRILCGYTLGDYIRMRRLSLAGSELAASNTRILDIAVKYGYDTQESFSRAFTRFHGVSPSQARNGASLKSFSRLSVKLSLDGGTIIDYRMETKDGFSMICKKTGLSSEKELSFTHISDFWRQCNEDGTIEALSQYIPEDSMFNHSIVGASFGKDARDPNHPYAIGTPCHDVSVIEDAFSVEEIPSHTYAVFQCRGKMPDAFHRLYHQIYSEFFPGSDYRPCGGTDFEVYPSADVNNPAYTCEIWVAVEKK